MRMCAVLLIVSLIGVVVACSEGTDDGGSIAIDGRWDKIGGHLADGVVKARDGREKWKSLVIYEDGKLTTDASCRGTAEAVGDRRSRLTFDCALGSVICDGLLVSDVKQEEEYIDDNGEPQVGYFAYDEVLEMTCPDDDTYIFAREEAVPPTDVTPTPSAP